MITLAVTLGDPGGIGPETALKAAYKGRLPHSLKLVLIGDRHVLKQHAGQLRLPLPPIWTPQEGKSNISSIVNWDPDNKAKPTNSRKKWKPGITGRSQGAASAHWIRCAVSGCLSGKFDGMVTGPICKKSLLMARVPFPGHTEYLARLTGTRRFAMMLIGGRLRVVLATRHLPISKVPASLTKNGIMETISLAAQAAELLQLKTRAVGVCALNPHAGEQGALGREERDIIIPAIKAMQQRGLDISGPIPADVIFHHAVKGRYGIVVAMYHDQGLAPLKTLAFDRGVNLTLGLPIIRTSPDHGTAFDIAGKGIADPGSMIAAIKLAKRIRPPILTIPPR